MTQLDPGLATVLVAGIGALGTWLAGRATRAGKAKETKLNEAAAERSDRDEQFAYLERSRDAAIDDAARAVAERDRYRHERDATDAHNDALIHALTTARLPIPPRPTGGTP